MKLLRVDPTDDSSCYQEPAEHAPPSTKAGTVHNPLFAHIPSDRPRIGIIVTREPHHLANSPWFRAMVNPTPFPTLAVSLRDIEFLATLPLDEVERQLADIANNPDRSTWALNNALDMNQAQDAENTLLQRAWDSYPWHEALDLDQA